MNYSLFISCAKGLEYLLENEIKNLGAHVERVSPQGVFVEASLGLLYQICLWSRLANRVHLLLFSGQAQNDQSLYALCHQFPWRTIFSADRTLAIEFNGSSKHFRNSMYGAQVIKDAIVDYFRKQQNQRPSIDREHPQIRIHAYLKQDIISVSLDLTGYSLHQRGYRQLAGEAPLKETLAAALLIRAQWPDLAAQGYALQDPFCGSGTLLIEGAMMAAHIAPGLFRNDQSFIYWSQHQPSLWEKLRAQALNEIKPLHHPIQGTDHQDRLIRIAQQNADKAGVGRFIQFEKKSLRDCRPIADKGLIITNPPYGERLSDATPLIPLYQELGKTSHDYFQNWQLAFITSNPLLAKATGLRASKHYSFYNGAIECKLYCLALDSQNQLKNKDEHSLSSGAAMLKNRLVKNIQHLEKWAKKNNISSYRLYDADLPEYAFAIDIYNDFAVLQEYKAPSHIPAHKTEARSLEVMQVVPTVLNITSDQLIIKQRQPQKGKSQYERLNQTKKMIIVEEGQAQFKVNLYDYLDTGLFLDHRALRLKFAQLAPGSKLLNLFCYTATASVHAALAGALTTNVDLSKTYLAWGEENFRLNHIDLSKHQFVHYDCLEWLHKTRDKFDVIFLDPPSFSNSKRMKTTLDIQRDHEILIEAAMRSLKKDGLLYFSTNLRQFKIASILSTKYSVRDISHETIDIDFKRNKRIHQCFIIKHLLPA